jgi:hypothetical protein
MVSDFSFSGHMHLQERAFNKVAVRNLTIQATLGFNLINSPNTFLTPYRPHACCTMVQQAEAITLNLNFKENF